MKRRTTSIDASARQRVAGCVTHPDRYIGRRPRSVTRSTFGWPTRGMCGGCLQIVHLERGRVPAHDAPNLGPYDRCPRCGRAAAPSFTNVICNTCAGEIAAANEPDQEAAS